MALLLITIGSFAWLAMARTRRALLRRAGLLAGIVALLAVSMAILDADWFGPENDPFLQIFFVAWFLGLGLAGGVIARALSLWARSRGHDRPQSLWIEVVTFIVVPFLGPALIASL